MRCFEHREFAAHLIHGHRYFVFVFDAVDECEKTAWGTYYTKKKPPFKAVLEE